jgi:transcription-repair coupling factor (superfamily II helicase)
MSITGSGATRGSRSITAAGAAHECLALEYAGGDRLYLPVENIELLSRYGHEEGLLDRSAAARGRPRRPSSRNASARWPTADPHRRRTALRKAPVLEPPTTRGRRSPPASPIQETDDQLRAIEDVLTDLAAGTPMDRLICGDVGFGKTEVAMRAAFVAAMSGACRSR